MHYMIIPIHPAPKQSFYSPVSLYEWNAAVVLTHHGWSREDGQLFVESICCCSIQDFSVSAFIPSEAKKKVCVYVGGIQAVCRKTGVVVVVHPAWSRMWNVPCLYNHSWTKLRKSQTKFLLETILGFCGNNFFTVPVTTFDNIYTHIDQH